MNKKELISAIADGSSVDKKLVEVVIEVLLTTIQTNIKSNEKVDISGFGSFNLKAKPARKARNPKTGESVDVPAKNAVTFKPAKALLASVQ